MNAVIDHPTQALTKKDKVKPLLPPVVCIEIPSKHNVELNKATALVQQLLRGRTVQYKISVIINSQEKLPHAAQDVKVFEDRKRLQPLIEEMKTTRSLYKEEHDVVSQNRYETLSLMRKQFIFNELVGKRDQVVNNFNGEVTAALLDFLAKELQRLEAEKQVQAFAMLAERVRWHREAVESGRRQKEDFNRKQHDDMFKQVMNIRNESVGIFLEDMLAKSISWLADDEARDYVRNVAHKVDMAAQQAHVRKDAIEQEEMITDLIYNYIMPDVKKAVTRYRLQESQKKYLEIADNIIQNELSYKPPGSNTRAKEELTSDEKSITDESAHFNRPDDRDTISEVFSKPSHTDVFKTHCLFHSKSEETYYKLKAQNEEFALQRAKLFQLAEVVKEELLDVLIGKAEEMALKIVQEKDKDFVFQFGSPEFEKEFETEKRLRMAKLMVLSEILNDDFLSNLIALAEGGIQEREELDDEERMRKSGLEGIYDDEERKRKSGLEGIYVEEVDERKQKLDEGRTNYEDGSEEDREEQISNEDEDRESVSDSFDSTLSDEYENKK